MARYTDNEAKEIFSRNLKKIMDDKGIDAPKLSAMIGLEKQAVYSWLKMKSFPSTSNLQKIIDELNVTSDDLLALHPATRKGLVPIPLYGTVAAGLPIEMLPVEDMKEAPARFVDDDPDAFMVKVHGTSMNRHIQDGEFALVSPRHTEPNERDMFLVTVNGYDATIKHVRKLENGVELVPDSYDPTHRPQVYDFGNNDTPTIKILGKVVWWCKEF